MQMQAVGMEQDQEGRSQIRSRANMATMSANVGGRREAGEHKEAIDEG